MRPFNVTAIVMGVLIAFGSALGAMAADLEVFLVRHAEKQSGQDPALTEAGVLRAEALADLLEDADITHIHSSDYKRTRQTVAPLAARLDLPVRLYDPRDLPTLADQLREEGGRHLVVGHSNTTPPLAEELGGEGGEPIVEATEYDRLYLVSITGDQTDTFLLRYGTRSP
ncbi:MAG: phosphoglycerate mutase family protein [Pseudomonadota bacterium]